MPVFENLPNDRAGVAWALDDNGSPIYAFGWDEDDVQNLDYTTAGQQQSFTSLTGGAVYDIWFSLGSDTHSDFLVYVEDESGNFGTGYRIKVFRGLVWPIKLLPYQDRIQVEQVDAVSSRVSLRKLQ